MARSHRAPPTPAVLGEGCGPPGGRIDWLMAICVSLGCVDYTQFLIHGVCKTGYPVLSAPMRTVRAHTINLKFNPVFSYQK